MYDNSRNYFIIERLDKDNESDNLKNVYDLSILNKIKEVNINSKNKIKKVKIVIAEINLINQKKAKLLIAEINLINQRKEKKLIARINRLKCLIIKIS